ncbi:flagellar motor switch protein FliG [Chachezhania antarctica]|uniref:flagellar motor switch protein FliG n=1 Tax=Chachezhania antarctica TaxID=2340860 RepID=UPI001F099E02|nr:FliG C-terminal domain-containing protein [Chachezhania antarctica]
MQDSLPQLPMAPLPGLPEPGGFDPAPMGGGDDQGFAPGLEPLDDYDPNGFGGEQDYDDGPAWPMPQPEPEPELDMASKAAIVVRLLLSSGEDLPLEELPVDLQTRLAQRMGAMGLVDRRTLLNVVNEFTRALEGVGLTFPEGLAGALQLLEGKISPLTAARLRKEAGVKQAGDPWARLRSLSADELQPLIEQESTEVAAVLLSKLDTPKAADLLSRLPGPLARRVAYAVSQTSKVTPEAVDRIGLALASQVDMRPMMAFNEAPGERLGAILNEAAASTRDDMLVSLDEQDELFATSVRKSIFTFAHIPARVRPRDVATVLRAADPAQLRVALAYATDEDNKPAADFILSNISSRMADNIREELLEIGTPRRKEGEAAMAAVVLSIREQARAGTMTLITPQDDEDD